MGIETKAVRSERTGVSGRRLLRLGLCMVVLSGGMSIWLGCIPDNPLDDFFGTSVASGIKIVNSPPTINIIQPSSALTIAQGDSFTIMWDDEDPDDNAVISIFLDPDANPNSGNELLILAGRQEDPDGTVNDSVEVDTGASSVPVGSYRIIALIQDAAGNSVRSIPDFQIQVLPEGISPGNQPPKLNFIEPTDNIGVVHGDKVCVVWTGSDPDNPEATVTLSLDFDRDPTNDDPNDSTSVIPLQSGLPVAGGPVIDPNLLDPNTIDPNTVDPICLGYEITIDTAGAIPPRDDGMPYYIQAKVDDGVNPPVYRYAIGSITVQKWAAGVVDLREIGEGLAGAIFQGFHGKTNVADPNELGGLAGSDASKLGDFDGDGYDDFIVAARHSNPRGRGPAGQAYLIYGRATRFSGINSLNSVATNIRGCLFVGGGKADERWWYEDDDDYGYNYNRFEGGRGGLASVTSTGDFDGDGLPEIIFGFPDAVWDETLDYDPLDTDDLIYLDDLPYPYSDADPSDDDYWIDRLGLVVYVSSQQPLPLNALQQNSIDLTRVGQHNPVWTVADDEGLGTPGAIQPRGARFRGMHPEELGVTSYGETVSDIPDTNADGVPELVFSAPDADDGRGRIEIVLGQNFADAVLGGLNGDGDPVKSFPVFRSTDAFDYGDGGKAAYRFLQWPMFHRVAGAFAGDRLGRAVHAGDFNMDGSPDIACGAPNADRNNLMDCGVTYIIYGQLVVGFISVADHPRVEIHGASAGDRLGETQDKAGDFNGDGVNDVVLGSRYFDPNGVTDAGFAAVLLGAPQSTGERVFSINDLGTPALPGVKFIGSTAGAMAGAMVSSAGDFNGDGRDDILICAPGAEHTFVFGSGTVTRVGVCYLIFGNNSLTNKTFSLSQVGSAELPGIAFVSPYQKGTADEAGVDTCFAIGDINGDGFDEVMIGNTTADYVNPQNPSQRRFDAGECYVVYGNNFGSNDPDRW